MWNVDEEPKNVWEWLTSKYWNYLPFFDGYQSPDGKYFISSSACFKLPGDVINFLKTGQIRNIRIFDNGLSTPTAESLGLRAHKDGRCVEIRIVK